MIRAISRSIPALADDGSTTVLAPNHARLRIELLDGRYIPLRKANDLYWLDHVVTANGHQTTADKSHVAGAIIGD